MPNDLTNVQLNPDDTLGNEGNNGTDVVAFNQATDFTVSEDNLTIMTEAGAHGFDKDNNIVDDKGEILLSKDEIDVNDFNTLSKDDFIKKYFDDNNANNGTSDTDTDDSAIIIDDVEYTIDDSGNAIDKEGKVFKTKEELIELEEVGDDTSDLSIEELAKLDGYLLNDEQGNPLEFENNLEGIVARNKLIIAKETDRIVTEQLDKFFAENNDIKSIYDYKRTHGSLDGYSDFVDYTKIDIDKDNISQLKDIIKTVKLGNGQTAEQVESYIKYLETEDLLLTEATSDLKILADRQIATNNEQVLAEQQRLSEIAQQNEKFFNETKALVETGVIGNFKIPDNLKIKQEDGTLVNVPKTALLDFMFRPITKEGYTAAQLKRAERNKSVENILLDELQLFVDYNTEQIIEDTVNNRNIKNLKTAKKNNSGTRRFKSSNGSQNNTANNVVL